MKKALLKILFAYIIQILSFDYILVNIILSLISLTLLYLGTKDIIHYIEEDASCPHTCIGLLIASVLLSLFGFTFTYSPQGQSWSWIIATLSTVVDMCFFHYLLELCALYNASDTYNVEYCQSRNRYYCIVMTIVIVASLVFVIYPTFTTSMLVVIVAWIAILWRLRILYKIRLDTVEKHQL